jgi:hypothetical protein
LLVLASPQIRAKPPCYDDKSGYKEEDCETELPSDCELSSEDYSVSPQQGSDATDQSSTRADIVEDEGASGVGLSISPQQGSMTEGEIIVVNDDLKQTNDDIGNTTLDQGGNADAGLNVNMGSGDAEMKKEFNIAHRSKKPDDQLVSTALWPVRQPRYLQPLRFAAAANVPEFAVSSDEAGYLDFH